MRKARIALISTLLLAVAFNNVALADNGIKIKRAYCTDDEAVLYVDGDVSSDSETSYQIGNMLCDDITSVSIEDAGLPFRSLVMVDNSLSISQEGREKEKDLIKRLIEGHADGELIRLATFSESVEYLSDYSTDYKALIGVTESISYNDQETYLTDVLYDVLDELKDDYSDGYSRIIIISDGVDNKPIGVTKDELYSKIKENPYPVYTIGTKNGKNDSELENMFALSRMTNADYFVLDDVGDVNEIQESFEEDYGLIVYKGKLPETAKTGGIQNSKLTVGDETAETVINTPFGDGVAETTSVEEKPTEPETESVTDEIVDEEEDDEYEYEFDLVEFLFDHMIILIIIAVALVLLIVIIISSIVSKSREKKEERNAKQAIPALSNSPGRVPFENAPTEVLLNNEEDGTNLMFAGGNESKVSYRLTLTDKNDPGKVFECELKDTVIIGRKSDVTDLAINYDKSVSSKHCMILSKNGHFYIQDLGSANHTKLNGNVIYAEEEVKNGDIITMGRVELYFSAI